jgi:hypothetical protein
VRTGRRRHRSAGRERQSGLWGRGVLGLATVSAAPETRWCSASRPARREATTYSVLEHVLVLDGVREQLHRANKHSSCTSRSLAVALRCDAAWQHAGLLVDGPGCTDVSRFQRRGVLRRRS